ncbi:hypothetical protein [Aurantiacibacter flavus]|uniref:ANTAR domain-containing protein n=1 Tax=Aurantiacibacter flavus TaxID=3145232 RepID=A0ABV0CSQ9_9SPHN
MPDDDAGHEAGEFARGMYALSGDLDELIDDARRRVDRLGRQSSQLLDLLLDGYGREDIVAVMGIAPAQFDEARATMLAELDASSITDAIRIGICAAYRRPRDSSESPD